MEERVQKLMAQANIGSRRHNEELIRNGRVTVNGKVIELGTKADPIKDIIEVDGIKIRPSEVEKVYYGFHKPPNVLSAPVIGGKDDRPLVRDLLPIEGHLFTIGRLDADSEGLMVLTNDGELTNKLAHPRYEHTKTYKITVYGKPTQQVLDEWQDGLWLEDERTAACYVRVLTSDSTTTTLRVIMTEGKKRQIRRIATKLGHPVKKLMRTHIGQLEIGSLKRGDWYQLGNVEVNLMSQPAPELELIRKRRRMVRERKHATRSSGNSTNEKRPAASPAHPASPSRPGNSKRPNRPGSRPARPTRIRKKD